MAALMLSSCDKGTQEKPKEDFHGIKTITTEIVDKGDQAVKNANRRMRASSATEQTKLH